MHSYHFFKMLIKLVYLRLPTVLGRLNNYSNLNINLI